MFSTASSMLQQEERRGATNRTTVAAASAAAATAAAAAADRTEAINDRMSHTSPSAVNGSGRGTPHTKSQRTPRSESAVKDGRRFLAAFREKRRNQLATDLEAKGTASASRRGQRGRTSHGDPSSSSSSMLSFISPITKQTEFQVENGGNEEHAPGDSLDVRPGLADAVVERIDSYQTCTPGLARKLETVLDASLRRHQPRKRRQQQHEGSANGDNREGLNVVPPIRQTKETDERNAAGEKDAGANGGDASPSPSADVATAVAIAAAGDVTRDAPRRTDGSRSPERFTPQMLRQAELVSQADFLSSVLPTQEGAETSNGRYHTMLPTTKSPERRGSSEMDANAKSRRETSYGRRSRVGRGTGAPGSASVVSAADSEAVARWASLRRLQDQGSGLATATERQLKRALELSRDLRGLKAGGALSGHERASCLDALQSSLHGLEEVLSKRSRIDRTARNEVQALGGPAVPSSVLGDWNDLATTESSNNINGSVDAGALQSLREKGGWSNAAQLKAFEQHIHDRSSMEIAALESERRKLRSKVEMFQRQVQLLQRGQTDKSSAAPSMRVGDGVGFNDAMASGDGGGPGLAGDGRFADLLDARLGEERHMQATLGAEVTSLRQDLEEKDGLIEALREALRSAATLEQQESANSTNEIGSEVSSTTVLQQLDQKGSSYADADGGASAASGGHTRAGPRGRVDESRYRGRYYVRSSRLLGAAGPVAMAPPRRHNLDLREGSRSENALDSVLGNGDDDHDHGTRRDSRRSSVGKGWRGSGDMVSEKGPPAVNEGYESSGGSSSGDSRGVVVGVPRDTHVSNSAGGSSGEAPAEGGDSVGTAPAPADTATAETFDPVSASFHSPGEASAFDQPSSVGVSPGEGNGVLSRATSVTGSALRVLWNSARFVGSRAGSQGASEAPNAARLRESSSHAVLIL